MHLTRNSCLMNGWGNSGRCFRCVKPFIQQGRESSKYFGERHSWPSHLQADLENNNHDKFAVSLLKHATVLGHGPQELSWVFWQFLGQGETITYEVTDQRKRGKATS